MNEEIRMISNNNTSNSWKPQNYGYEVLDLLKSKNKNNELIDANGFPTNAGALIIQETSSILEICGDPKESIFNETGLVIGYVQNGKTLSFTALTAMARDNNYQLIIVIAGTSKPLSEQTTERLKKDLRLPRPDRNWILLANPKNENQKNR